MKPHQKKRKKDSTNLEPVAETKSVDDNSFKAKCMRNSVVLRTILSNLSTSDLLNCRLVNKLWHSEVNSAMRRSNIALKISSQSLLDQVELLTDLLPNMSLPFNGLSFKRFSCPKIIEDSRNASPHEFLQILPPIKYLRFDHTSASEELILRIIESNTSHLEVLSFYDDGESLPTGVLTAIFQLKKLKKITLTAYPCAYEDRKNLGAIIKKCETLESVEKIPFYDFKSVPENRWHVIKCFVLCKDAIPWGSLEKYLQAVPTNRRLTSLMIRDRSSSLQEKRLILNLVSSCKETLTSLSVDLRTVQLQSVFTLCDQCKSLRILRIEGVSQSRLDIESDLLGIFPEELLLLREMILTVAQLRKLEIVPVRPALQHLIGLVELIFVVMRQENNPTLLLNWDRKRDGNIDYRRSWDASKIFKALSLERMRSLWT